MTRAPAAWDVPKCRRCWRPHLHRAVECVQRAEGGVQELLVSWGGWAPSQWVLGLCLGRGCYICPAGLSPGPGFGGKGRGRDPRAESCVQPALLSRLKLFWKRRPSVQGLGGQPRRPASTVLAGTWLLLRCSPQQCPQGSWDLPQSLGLLCEHSVLVHLSVFTKTQPYTFAHNYLCLRELTEL